MKRVRIFRKDGSTLFLRLVIVAVSFYVLGLCMFVLPYISLSEETEQYRVVAMALYIPAVPFFVAVYQTMKLLRYIDKNMAFSENSVYALKIIRYCGFIIALLFGASSPLLRQVGPIGDHVFMPIAFVVMVASLAVAVFAAVLQKLLRNALDIKAENDLTV